jgi:hypothetical protein
MNSRFFDGWTRRTSLAGLGAAGLLALGSSLATARNENRNRKNKIDKKARQKCQKQVGPCNAVLEDECGNDPDCLACCEFAGRCDFAGFIDCLESQEA